LSLRERFVAAALATEWRSSSGTVHPFRVCATCPRTSELAETKDAFVDAAGAHIDAAAQVRSLNGDRPADDFTPLADTTPTPRTVASAVAEASGHPSMHHETLEDGSDRIVGTLVHRMLERFGFERDGSSRITRESVLHLLDSRDLSDTTALSADDLADSALHRYRAICGRPEIAALYLAGDRWHEVPFTMRTGDSVWRGTIDCLIRTSPTAMAVLEFKTGKPRPEHQIQLELYRDAASRLFPGMAVEAYLVYPGDPSVV
jgi:ATP-dependent exoDNAse (exonuclease V) beta subunit